MNLLKEEILLKLDDFQESKENCLSDIAFYDFLNVLINERDYGLINSDILLNNFVVINLTDYTIAIPKLTSSKKFIIVPIRIISFVNSLDFNYSTIGHTNVAIYNTSLNTLELFEPHGKQYSGYNPLKLDVTGMIHYAASKIFKKDRMVFINLGGMQYKQNLEFPKAGHCTVWCLLFINYHILNLNIQKLMNWKSKDLNSYIRKYLMKIKTETIFNSPKVEYQKLETIKIQINSNLIVNRIKYLFGEFYKQIENFTKTTIHSEFIKFNKYKELLFIELKSFVLYYPDVFQEVCLKYHHKFNYTCNDF